VPPRRTRYTSVSGKLPVGPKAAPPPRTLFPKLTLRSPKGTRPVRRRIARLIEEEESTVLDMLDNLLDKGVVLTADVMLSLANVDLIYLRLSAVLVAAGRVLPKR
jgi:hypothetical protein